MEKGNPKNGAVTDLDGNFSLNVRPGATLVVSYIGYKTQEVTVGNQPDIAITLNNGGSAYDWNKYIDKDLLAAYQNGSNAGTDWLDALRNKNAVTTNHAINITGGSDRSKFSTGSVISTRMVSSADSTLSLTSVVSPSASTPNTLVK